MAKKPNAQWPAHHLAAAELCRHGYVVASTMGNTPTADLMVGKPDGTSMFWVDVKGLANGKTFLATAKPPHENLFYILVLVGKERGNDKFFVLTQEKFNGLIKAQGERDLARGKKPLPGFVWPHYQRFQDKWSVLPGWSGSSI